MRDPLLASQDLEHLPVYDADQLPIGETFGVLTEAETGLVRFFDVAIDGLERHVLIPVGHARLEKYMGRLRVRLRAASVQELERIPAYEPHLAWHDDDFQNNLLTAFGRLFEGQRYYAHPAFDHDGLYAGPHPLLREPLAPVTASGLRRLSASREFRVAEGESDIRGWMLIGEDDTQIGRVTDLVIDAEAEQVRYLIVERDHDGKECALPIGYVELAKERVHAPLSDHDLDALPEFTGDEMERSYEVQLRAVLDSLLSGSRRYLRPDFHNAA